MQSPVHTPTTPQLQLETEEIAKRDAQKPVGDEIGQHRRPRVARTSKSTRSDGLHTVEQLERGRD